MPSPHHALFEAFGRFRVSWPRRGWSYDSRVQCVASTFDSTFAAQAQALVATILPHGWTETTLLVAPTLISRVAKRTGGVRSSQMIFAADPTGYVTPYGLWWPWETAQTISLRIGLEGASDGDIADLCVVFGAEQ